jgi:hypothetical protein
MERDRTAVQLRSRGLTYDEIGQELGFRDRSGARKAVERGLSQHLKETAEQTRALELQRTDVVIARLMPLIDRENPDLRAVDRLIKIGDQRARMLGLYRTPPQQPELPADYAIRTQTTDKGAHIQAFLQVQREWQQSAYEAGQRAGLNGMTYDEYTNGDDDDDASPGSTHPLDADNTTSQYDNDAEDGEECEDEQQPQPGRWVAGRFVPDLISQSSENPTTPEQAGPAPPPPMTAEERRKMVHDAWTI